MSDSQALSPVSACARSVTLAQAAIEAARSRAADSVERRGFELRAPGVSAGSVEEDVLMRLK